ncbi:hypothetical protein BCON_0183g00170 [Botryotinia convoluta]|uniref:Uncharacterized protein n=1 Tax=Botryotinia convoluta TaxID=54673 RepID=A0A4Z1HNK4_9HELO|nr:hypothetical protein BCON_0183g00170 [Botryotinia convoluta]
MLGTFPSRTCELRSHTYSSKAGADDERAILSIWGKERGEVAVEGLGDMGGDRGCVGEREEVDGVGGAGGAAEWEQDWLGSWWVGWRGGSFKYSVLPTKTGDTDTCEENQKVLEIEAKAEEGDED